MPVFSKMMASRPFQYIKGMPIAHKAMMVGALAGGLEGGMRRDQRGNGHIMRGALAGAGMIGAGLYGSQISSLAKNVMRNPGMAGRQVMGAGRNAFQRAATLGRNVRRMF